MEIWASMTGSGQERYALAHRMSAAWAAFARTGNPNSSGSAAVAGVQHNERPTMILSNECKVVNDPDRETRLALKAAREAGQQRSTTGA